MPETKEYQGIIEGWFETGLEGVVWVLYENGRDGYDALQVIESGDHLTIYGKDGSIIFDEQIAEDHEAGMTENACGRRQPTALGYWIHWTQKGWDPDEWAELFFSKPSLRAKLIKKTEK